MSKQGIFSAALRDGRLPTPEGLVQPNGQAASQRFDVYRNNVSSSLIDAIVSGFPVLSRLLGEEYLRALGQVFVQHHPPRTPIIAAYGGDLPDFIDGFEPLSAYPYLKDTARLELARRSSTNATDAISVAAQQLAGLSGDQLFAAIPTPHPSLQILESSFPIHAIWLANVSDTPSSSVDFNAGAQTVLLVRPNMEVEQYLLSPAECAFVSAIDGATTLAGVAQAVLVAEPACDVAQIMATMVQRGVIQKFTLSE